MADFRELLLNRLVSAISNEADERARRMEAERRAEAVTRTADGCSPIYVVQLLEAMASDRKIDAIKLYRQMTGYGLKESKEAIERVTDRMRRLEAA